MSLTRRDFMKAGLVLTGGALVPRWARAEAATPDVVHASGGSAAEKVRAAVDALGGMERYVKAGQRVLINPNAGFPNPAHMATTTDPAAIEPVIEMCREAGAREILVADYPVRDPELCFERSGIGDLARLPGAQVSPLTARSPYTTTTIPGAVEVTEVDLATAVGRADVLIAMPIAKSHSSAGVSFAMKGNMGLIQARGPFHSRYDLHQAVADLAKLVTPTLVITDAQRALVTRGPGGPGRVETPDAIIAGTNAASVDAYTVGIAQWYNRAFTPDQVRHIKLAGEQGIGEIDLARLTVRRIELEARSGAG